MRAPLDEVARARLYRLVTRLPPGVRERAPAGGTFAIASGPAKDLRMAGVPYTHVQAYGLVRGTLETSVQEALRRTVAPGGVVHDIGSNVGFFTLLAARLAGPDGRVEAFEPVPATAAVLRRNAALNPAGATVHVHELALTDHAGRDRLLRPGQPSDAHLAERGRHPDTREEIDVEVATLDALVAAGRVAPPDVVKLDVEGSEISVLEGARAVLERHRPVLVCELHETNAELCALLDDAGYAVENLDGPEPVLEAGPVHVLARPPGRPEITAPG